MTARGLGGLAGKSAPGLFLRRIRGAYLGIFAALLFRVAQPVAARCRLVKEEDGAGRRAAASIGECGARTGAAAGPVKLGLWPTVEARKKPLVSKQKGSDWASMAEKIQFGREGERQHTESWYFSQTCAPDASIADERATADTASAMVRFFLAAGLETTPCKKEKNSQVQTNSPNSPNRPTQAPKCLFFKAIRAGPLFNSPREASDPQAHTPGAGRRAAASIDLLGMMPGDTLVDVFPGTGIVSRAWAELSARATRAASSAGPQRQLLLPLAAGVADDVLGDASLTAVGDASPTTRRDSAHDEEAPP